MFHPFKKLEASWNSRTPDYLHPRTKANFIWQIKMTVLLILGMIVVDEIQERRARRNRKTFTEDHYTEQ